MTNLLPGATFAKLLKILAIVLIVLGLPVGVALPGWWGWENRPVEDAQSVILIFGFLHAILLYRLSGSHSKWLWLAGIPLWFVLIAREFSFGATFLPSVGMTDHGPGFPVSHLVYKPFITPVVLALIAFSIGVIIWKRLDRLGAEMLRGGMAPWFSLSLVVVGMVLSSLAEMYLGDRLPLKAPMNAMAAQNVEEITELGAYIALWAAQLDLSIAFLRRRERRAAVSGFPTLPEPGRRFPYC